jgi:hypothetical protein
VGQGTGRTYRDVRDGKSCRGDGTIEGVPHEAGRAVGSFCGAVRSVVLELNNREADDRRSLSSHRSYYWGEETTGDSV